MSRYAIAGLRVLGSLGAGAAAWTTFWLIRGGEPGPAAYVASLAAALAVYVASVSPAPRPWGRPAEASPAGADEPLLPMDVETGDATGSSAPVAAAPEGTGAAVKPADEPRSAS